MQLGKYAEESVEKQGFNSISELLKYSYILAAEQFEKEDNPVEFLALTTNDEDSYVTLDTTNKTISKADADDINDDFVTTQAIIEARYTFDKSGVKEANVLISATRTIVDPEPEAMKLIESPTFTLKYSIVDSKYKDFDELVSDILLDLCKKCLEAKPGDSITAIDLDRIQNNLNYLKNVTDTKL